VLNFVKEIEVMKFWRRTSWRCGLGVDILENDDGEDGKFRRIMHFVQVKPIIAKEVMGK
jgi:hypothetical protein